MHTNLYFNNMPSSWLFFLFIYLQANNSAICCINVLDVVLKFNINFYILIQKAMLRSNDITMQI